MKTPPESVNLPRTICTTRNDIRKNNPRLRTIHDLRFHDVFVIHSRPTR
jgi:hypothetical protein